MRVWRRAFFGAAVAAVAITAAWGSAQAADKTVGVSWRHFQEERWKIDEAGIKEVLEKAGLTLDTTESSPSDGIVMLAGLFAALPL